MKSLFNEFLERRGLSVCPLPLWRLKITDSEYFELRTYLADNWRSYRSFGSCPREVALYMAEWWKRDPDMGEEQGLENRIFLSLGLDENREGKDNFIKNARRVMKEQDPAFLGFKPLVIRHHLSRGETGMQKRTYYDYTLLYQGGFPMGKACSGKENNKWAICIPKFTQSNLSLGDIPGNVIAGKLLGEYKEVLVTAAREKRPDKMPFECKSKDHPWYVHAVNGINKGFSDMEGRPFRISWTVEIRNGMGTIRCSIHGNAELKDSFLKFHPSARVLDSITIQLYVDGQHIQNIAEYSAFDGREGRGFLSFSETVLSVDYIDGSKVSLRIAETGEVICSSSFDMGVPHAFFWNGYIYTAGSRFGINRSIILFKAPWCVEEKPAVVPVRKVVINGEEYSYLDSLPQEDGSYFVLHNPNSGDSYENGSDARNPEWVEIEIKPDIMLGLIKEKVADFSNNEAFTVFRCTSEEDKEIMLPEKCYFRSDGGGEWLPTPPIGRMSCAVIEQLANRGETISLPENGLINVGPELSIIRKKSQPFETRYLLTWGEGEIFINSQEALRDGDEWVCSKESFPEYIPLRFIPRQGEPFDLTLRATYRQTAIFSPYGGSVERGEIIPLSQLAEYRYKLTDIERFRLRCDEDAFDVNVSNIFSGEDFQHIPEEGSLILPVSKRFLAPFKSKLENDGCVIDFRTIQFVLMDYPIKADYSSQERAFHLQLRNSVKTNDENWNQSQEKIVSTFRGNIVISSMIDGSSIELTRGEDGLFKIPESFVGDFAVASTLRGYIRPFIFNPAGGQIVSIDKEREREALLSLPLNTGEWSLASRFLDLGLRYSLNVLNLPWIGAVLYDGSLLSLFLFQELAQDLISPSSEDVLRAKIMKAAQDATYPITLPDEEWLQSFVESSASPEAFVRGFELWKHSVLGDVEGDPFSQYLRDALAREQSFIEKLL